MTLNPDDDYDDDDELSISHPNSHEIAKQVMPRKNRFPAMTRPRTPSCSDPGSNAWYYSKKKEKKKKKPPRFLNLLKIEGSFHISR